MKLCEKIFNSRGKLLVFLFVFMFFYPYSQFKVNVVRYSRVFTKLAMNNQIKFFFLWSFLENSNKFWKIRQEFEKTFLYILKNHGKRFKIQELLETVISSHNFFSIFSACIKPIIIMYCTTFNNRKFPFLNFHHFTIMKIIH